MFWGARKATTDAGACEHVSDLTAYHQYRKGGDGNAIMGMDAPTASSPLASQNMQFGGPKHAQNGYFKARYGPQS